MNALDFTNAYNARHKVFSIGLSDPRPIAAKCSVLGPIDTLLTYVPRPFYNGKVAAGQSHFPSPAQDYEPLGGKPAFKLDLNERFIRRPAATFLLEVIGDSMTGVGIYPGTILIVEKGLRARSSTIVVAVVDGEMMVKRYFNNGKVVKLLSENPDHPPITIAEDQDATIWGIVKYWISSDA